MVPSFHNADTPTHGRVMVVGPRDDVLPRVTRPAAQPAASPQLQAVQAPESASLAS